MISKFFDYHTVHDYVRDSMGNDMPYGGPNQGMPARLAPMSFGATKGNLDIYFQRLFHKPTVFPWVQACMNMGIVLEFNDVSNSQNGFAIGNGLQRKIG
jgi:hypothetical protein